MIVHPWLRRDSCAAERTGDRLEEAVGLARAIGLDVRGAHAAPCARIAPSTWIGKGSAETIGAEIEATGAGLVVMDCTLSPGQQRNLERRWNCKVIDRTALILEIFGARARTREGRLQVELAHLTWQRSRLVRSWTHLERQRGGFGFVGGPGESQIELDRRLIGRPDRPAEARSGNGKETAGPAPQGAPALSLSGGGAGRLYQCG